MSGGWDGKNIWIFQSRNITTLNKSPKTLNYTYNKNNLIGIGDVVCKGVSKGYLKVIKKSEDYDKIEKGDIIFIKCKADTIFIKKISLINGLVIKGGVLSHIAVIAREFNVPCLTEFKLLKGKINNYTDKKIIIDALKGQILLN